MSLSSKPTSNGLLITIDDIIVQRKVPFNEQGHTVLRAIRKQMEDELSQSQGVAVSLPFPTVIHLTLLDYANSKGIPIDD